MSFLDIAKHWRHLAMLGACVTVITFSSSPLLPPSWCHIVTRDPVFDTVLSPVSSLMVAPLSTPFSHPVPLQRNIWLLAQMLPVFHRFHLHIYLAAALNIIRVTFNIVLNVCLCHDTLKFRSSFVALAVRFAAQIIPCTRGYRTEVQFSGRKTTLTFATCRVSTLTHWTVAN